MCRALIDSGAGGSYASAKLIKLIDKKPSETKLQRADMLMGSKTGRMEFYDVEVSSLDGNYKMDVSKKTRTHQYKQSWLREVDSQVQPP